MRLACRDDSVTRNELGHDAASGLDTERERADIDKDDITEVLITGKNAALDGSTVSDSLVGVDTLRQLLVEVLLEELLDLQDVS